eukprot:gene9954-10109_t
MGPKSKGTKRGLLGVGRYDSETDEDYVPYGSAAHQARKKRKMPEESEEEVEIDSSASDTEPSDGLYTAMDQTSESSEDETLADRQQRLAVAEKESSKRRRKTDIRCSGTDGFPRPRGKRQHGDTLNIGTAAADKPGRGQRQRQRQQQPAPASGWDSLPAAVLAKVFLAVCSHEALPMAPCLACVCSSWAAAVAETPELFQVIDTAYLSARASLPAASAPARQQGAGVPAGRTAGKPSRRSSAEGKRVQGAAKPGHASIADAGIAGWVASGRLQQLQELRITCAGSNHLSIEDPQFFEDEESKAADPSKQGVGGATCGLSGSSSGCLSGAGNSTVELSGLVLLQVAQHCKHLQKVSLCGAPSMRAEVTAVPALYAAVGAFLQQLDVYHSEDDVDDCS